MARRAELARDLPRLGLNREEAAAAVGICGTTFDKLVRAGHMPRPKMIGAKKLWFLESLRAAFMALPEEEDGAGWDDVAA